MPLMPVFDPNAAPSRKRRKIFEVSPALLVNMGRGIFEVVEDPLPRDAAIADMRIDPSTGNLQMIVLSEEFPEVPESEFAPHICPKIQRYVPPETPKWVPREFL